ncbi:hypothetical protein HYH03_000592 [Edaphochlamys debaryana]|uniref:Ubiquinone biosynthesis protein n=1 Tax=Edaphochlamys debaryana TaxID=47281 RepID=A0A835YPB2_9CHLO|nr:hypothetical protein HYH03_000592 [Edaphochlamys debaryana]|eukprot:KAG2502100.1 hypothetical protein HYH03_000592 [Edaphochlamys debaryana]
MLHVPSRGWSASALVDAARDLGLSPATSGLLPRGEGDLVEHFMVACNTRCVEELLARKEELMALPLEERVAVALQLRLEMLAPLIDTWPQALAVASRPSNAAHSLRLLYGLVDDVWAALGDDSTDASWYSKRALLAGAYTATSLYMLTDYSPGFRDTWDALRRRVAEGLALDASIARAVRSASSMASAAADDAAHASTSASGTAPPPPPGPAAAEAAAEADAAAAQAAAAEQGATPMGQDAGAAGAGKTDGDVGRATGQV